MHPAQLLLTVEEVAEMLSVASGTVRRLAKSGQMPAPVEIGGKPRWRVADIRAWIEGLPVAEGYARPDKESPPAEGE